MPLADVSTLLHPANTSAATNADDIVLTHPIDPWVDVVFKALFGSPSKTDLLVDFLNAVLRPDSPIVGVQLADPAGERLGAADKAVTLEHWHALSVLPPTPTCAPRWKSERPRRSGNGPRTRSEGPRTKSKGPRRPKPKALGSGRSSDASRSTPTVDLGHPPALWRSLFLCEDGPFGSLLGTIGIPPIGWLGDHFWTNFIPNLVTNTWLGFPFMMVVSLGALQSIPGDLYEAASLDGASAWQRFRSITLPLLKPALLPAIILGTIWTFNLFNVIYLVSMGAGNTEILITEAYRAFHEQHRHGYAAAYSVLIFFILLAYTWVTTRVTKASEGAVS